MTSSLPCHLLSLVTALHLLLVVLYISVGHHPYLSFPSFLFFSHQPPLLSYIPVCVLHSIISKTHHIYRSFLLFLCRLLPHLNSNQHRCVVGLFVCFRFYLLLISCPYLSLSPSPSLTLYTSHTLYLSFLLSLSLPSLLMFVCFRGSLRQQLTRKSGALERRRWSFFWG